MGGVRSHKAYNRLDSANPCSDHEKRCSCAGSRQLDSTNLSKHEDLATAKFSVYRPGNGGVELLVDKELALVLKIG